MAHRFLPTALVVYGIPQIAGDLLSGALLIGAGIPVVASGMIGLVRQDVQRAAFLKRWGAYVESKSPDR